jgi:hypothetical protein
MSHGVAKGLFLAHRGRETGMRKLKRCRSSWAPAAKEIAALWHGELVLAIEQGVKLKRALHLRLREQHEFAFRLWHVLCFSSG